MIQVDIEPKVKRRIPGWAFVGPAVSAVIIGYYGIGPSVFLVAAIAFGGAIVLAFAGPRINARLYGGASSASADFSASAIMQRTAGQVQLESGELTWRPQQLRAGCSPLRLPLGDISRVVLRPLPGIPRSCRVRCELLDGTTVEMTIFARPPEIARAFRAVD